MRKLIFTTIIILTTFMSFAQHQDSLQAGNTYYANNEFEQAISTYTSIIDAGHQSAELYFNLGNAYYKTNDPVHAILYFEKAKLLAPSDEDIQFNLDLANQFVVDKIEPLPRPFFINWLQATIKSMDSKTWAIFSIATFILLLFFGLGYVFIQKTGIKKLSFSLGIVMLIFSVITFVFSAQQKKALTAHNKAIIFTPSVTVKASPNDSSVDLFVIHEGLKVEIVKSLSNWLEIKMEDGNRGWIKEESLKRI